MLAHEAQTAAPARFALVGSWGADLEAECEFETLMEVVPGSPEGTYVDFREIRRVCAELPLQSIVRLVKHAPAKGGYVSSCGVVTGRIKLADGTPIAQMSVKNLPRRVPEYFLELLPSSMPTCVSVQLGRRRQPSTVFDTEATRASSPAVASVAASSAIYSTPVSAANSVGMYDSYGSAPTLHASGGSSSAVYGSSSPGSEPSKIPVGRFEVDWMVVLGRGGFGQVYRAFDPHTAELLAMKECLCSDRAAAEGLRKEAALLQRLSHPAIVQLRHLETVGDRAYMFMELMTGGSVASLIKARGALAEPAVLRLGASAVEGLRYLHAEGVLHRDLKPGNMLLSSTGKCKLADFGLSRVLQTSAGGVAPTTGNVVGTVAYMSPEAIQGKYSQASDVWAMACALCEMGSGQVPWADLSHLAGNQIGLVFHIATSGAHPAIPPTFSAGLQDALSKCFHTEPKQRPSAEELSTLLKSIAAPA
jgi:hypothetical protein